MLSSPIPDITDILDAFIARQVFEQKEGGRPWPMRVGRLRKRGGERREVDGSNAPDPCAGMTRMHWSGGDSTVGTEPNAMLG